ncbi:hypothetical protein PAECIP111891_06697 [Paenibacillus allorhizoplanae]|uniref:YopX protein domain-containing protein n=1 Tax=Paenibacillus allorhizoplanae TaxID=2905648 RepID=A0ABN8H5I8_9BACL|nr:hypothetical protein [Paenibacillus allorhizoplanae]CAH1230610.1 hypothetical protein PAECIP111891_06697 [Paenibacillus allorhizoplanae]
MKFKLNTNGYSALVSNHLFKGMTLYRQRGTEVNAGEIVTIYDCIDGKWEKYNGERGVIRRVWYKRFFHYEVCYVSIFLWDMELRKTIWIDVECLELTGVKAQETGVGCL